MNHIPSIATNLRGEYRFGFNGQEKDDEVTGQSGSMYSAQFWEYDSRIGRRWNLDPKPQISISDYACFGDNPVFNIDVNGDNKDGYKNLRGYYKWYDNETSNVIRKEGIFWQKVTNDKEVFNKMSAGKEHDRYLPKIVDPGSIKQANYSSSAELWLGEPSDNMGEGVAKIAANIAYSYINSPFALVFGETIGGEPLDPIEKTEAFVDVVPSLISFGLGQTGAVIKTCKGLKGFNKFVDEAGLKATNLPQGINWHQWAGRLFQQNKVQQEALKHFSKSRKASDVIDRTKEEIKK